VQLWSRAGGIEITVVNRENFFLFTPMPHEVAASDLDLAYDSGLLIPPTVARNN
jgi:NADH dehydrogenase FAD-containing subunit